MPDLTTLLSQFLTDLYSGSIGGTSLWSSLTLTKPAIGVTSTDGLTLTNTTAAAVGAQQISPRIRLRGFGWKTDATAASQAVDWVLENLPVQGAANPSTNLLFKSSINGGAYATVLTLSPSAVTSTVPYLAPNGTALLPSFAFASEPNTGMFRLGADYLGFSLTDTTIVAVRTDGFELRSDGSLQWSGGAIGGGADVLLGRGAANRLDLASGDSFRAVLGTVDYANANGQLFSAVQQLTELTTIAAAATTDTTIQMPATAVVLSVSVRVTTIIPTAATFTVGDSGSAARFSTAAVTVAAGSTDPGTKAGAYYNAAALSIRITPNLTPADNTGRVRVTIYYYTVTPPTS